MSDVVIRVDELGKRYQLGELDPYRSFREAVTDAVRKRLSKAPDKSGPTGPDHHWALAGASFTVAEGEVLGIVGRNGAGKSTLLKLLSRVTRPTTGTAWMGGRVGSLLEVGTGFHPELTGRENVYLNGVILGMRREVIERQFDRIVEFAGVEDFLDTPVKRYSSGMQVRLGFAVAAHLQTEILIIDEVLAVGDAEFQHRCLGKIGDVVEQGRTVLFVSHNMSAVQALCPRTLLLEDGRVIGDGPTSEVIATYLARVGRDAIPAGWVDVSDAPRRRGSGRSRVTGLSYTSGVQRVGFGLFPGSPLEVTLAIESDTERTIASAAVIVYDVNGTKLVNADTIAVGQALRVRRGRSVVSFRINELHLNPGSYVLGWWLSDPVGNNIFDHVEHGISLEVLEDTASGAGIRPPSDGVIPCSFAVTEEDA
jgi:lipopolysaccharide transport system ATP-binding protein